MSINPAASYRVVLLTADRFDDAELLAAELRAQALRAGGTRASIEVSRDATVFDASAKLDDPTTALVILGGPATARNAPIADAAWKCQQQLRACIPVFNPASVFQEQLPAEVHELNGVPWPHDIDARTLAAIVLRTLGLTESERRVFISYRRTDGSVLAEQLRRALIDGGWEVFLDRYSVPPAEPFQQRLDRDLADKGFVLLLKTPDAADSRWVDHEVAFAYLNNLGLMSLAFPDTAADKLISSLDENWRLRIDADQLLGPPHGRRLRASVLASVLQLIDEQHARAYQLRREGLLVSIDRELRRQFYRVRAIDHWVLHARRDDRDELILATARAPEPSDLFQIENIRRRTRVPRQMSRAWVVHPLEDIDADRARLVRWLSGRRSVRPSPLMMLGRRLSR